MRQPPRSCFPGRPAADRLALLHQRRRSELQAAERLSGTTASTGGGIGRDDVRGRPWQRRLSCYGRGRVRWPSLRRREANGGLEVVAAVLAMPKVAHTAAVEIFRPFRDE